jgi:hypothetical protein
MRLGRGRAGNPSLVSDACFDAAARGLVSDAVGIRLCRDLVQLTRRPVTLVPQPMPSDAILSSPSPQHAAWRLAREAGDDAAIARLFASLVRDLLGRTDGRLFYEDPADEPECAPHLSPDEYGEMVVRLWSHVRGTALPERRVPRG